MRLLIKGDLEVIKNIHNNDTNINFNNDDYALHLASFCRNLEIVKYLLQNGARINYTNKNVCFVYTNSVFIKIWR